MKRSTRIFSPIYFIFIVLIIASFSLAACASTTSEAIPDEADDQQAQTTTEVMLPVLDKSGQESGELEVEDQAYPEPEPEGQDSAIADIAEAAAYPEPEMEEAAQANDESSPKDEAYPAPQEQPVQEIKPTPRGNELVATNPSTFKLASGQLQLVELFAFW